jgi:hypothetical protein
MSWTSLCSSPIQEWWQQSPLKQHWEDCNASCHIHCQTWVQWYSPGPVVNTLWSHVPAYCNSWTDVWCL